MCIYIYIYIYVCVYIYIYIHTHTPICCLGRAVLAAASRRREPLEGAGPRGNSQLIAALFNDFIQRQGINTINMLTTLFNDFINY